MAKTASHINPLPPELLPTKSSVQQINEHIQRLLDGGERQKTIALSLGFSANYVSMLKAREELPLPRVIAFAHAARLSDAERRELLHTRLMELHCATFVVRTARRSRPRRPNPIRDGSRSPGRTAGDGRRGGHPVAWPTTRRA